MFAALTLGRFHPEPSTTHTQANGASRKDKPLTPIAKASELAIASLQGILSNTCKVIDELEKNLPTEGETKGVDEAQERVDRMRRRELSVVQSKREIESPTIVYHAKWISG